MCWCTCKKGVRQAKEFVILGNPPSDVLLLMYLDNLDMYYGQSGKIPISDKLSSKMPHV